MSVWLTVLLVTWLVWAIAFVSVSFWRYVSDLPRTHIPLAPPPRASEGGLITPEQYGVQVGRAWVAFDFKAEALYITLGPGKSASTEEVGGPTGGVLVDYDQDGRLIGVEVLG